MDDKTALADVKLGLTWGQKHERLILGTLLLCLVFFLGNKWMNHTAQVDHDKAVISQQVANEQAVANKALADQIAKQTEVYQQEQAAREKEMAALVTAIASRDSVAAKKVTQVSAPKTAQQAVDDLSTEYTLAAPVTVTATGADVPTVDLQQFTVAKIERDAFEGDLKDTKTELDSAKQGEAQAKALVTSLQTEVAGLNVAITKNNKASDDEISDIKSQARKGKRNWFIAGFVAGLGTRLLARF